MKKKNGNPKVAGVMFVILAIVMFAMGVIFLVSDIDFLLHGADNINDMIAENRLEAGEFVEIDVNATFGAYAETKHTINGFIPAGKEQHYVIWFDDDSLISMTVKGNKKYDTLDSITDNTSAYIMGTGTLSETAKFTGKLETVSGELRGYYQDALDYLGVDSSVKVYYLDIDTTESKGSIIGMTLFMVALGVIFIIAAAGSFKQAKANKAENNMQANAYNPNMPTMPYDANAQNNVYDPNMSYDANMQNNTYDPNNQQ